MTRLDTYHFGALLKQLGLSLEFFAIYTTSLDLLTAAAFVGIGIVVFWRVRDDWMALVSSLANVNVIMGLLPGFPFPLNLGNVWHTLAISLRAFGYFTAILFFYIFPDGRFTPRWTRLFAILLALHAVSWLFWPAMMPPMDFGAINILDKLAALVLALFFMGSGVVAQVVRFRSNTDPVNACKLAGCCSATGGAGQLCHRLSPGADLSRTARSGLPNLVFLLAAIPILIASLIALPVTMAVSILRYRLWDIDLIIRRTLVYGMLSAVLGLVYLVSVVLLQQALRF